MTPKQTADLATLDAALALNSDDLGLLNQRLRLLGESRHEFAVLVDAWTVYERAALAQGSRNHDRWEGYYRARWAQQAREQWQSAASGETDSWVHSHLLSGAVALFALLVETSEELIEWRAAQASDFDALACLREAECVDLERLPLAWKRGDLADWIVRALALRIARGLGSGGWAFAQGLRVGLQHRNREIAPAVYARRARQTERADYERLGWWNLAIESAPHDPKWLGEKGRLLRRHNHRGAAAANFTRAIALAPDEPFFYEERAKAKVGLSSAQPWWDMDDGASSDYARAIRLRIARGEIRGEPHYLAAQGAKFPRTSFQNEARARVFAFYSLAIAGDGSVGLWHYECARLLTLGSSSLLQLTAAAIEAAQPHFLRALALDATLYEARRMFVGYATRSKSESSTHQKMELLIEVRQMMRDAGVGAQLSGEMLAEIEAKLMA